MSFYDLVYRTLKTIQSVMIPSLMYSQDIYEEILRRQLRPDVEWLDVGCGNRLLPYWRQEEEERLAGSCKSLVGIDYDMYSLRNHKNIAQKVRGDITSLPFKDNSFDLVTANMVVEHLDNPDIQFQEIRRVLKPDGTFIFHTPNASGYVALISKLVPGAIRNRLIYLLEKRKAEDVYKTHYRANSTEVINSLAQKVGFEVVKTKMLVTSAELVMIPPLLILELLWIRTLMTKPFKPYRTNIIATLRSNKQTADANLVYPNGAVADVSRGITQEFYADR